MPKHDRRVRRGGTGVPRNAAVEFARPPVEFGRLAAPGDAARRVEEIIAGIPREFVNVEVLKHAVRRERGTFVIALSLDREGGVDTGLCEHISRFIANRLDADPSIGNYSLEVASAGLDRPLLTPVHFGRFLGRDARIITHLRIANRVEFVGTIQAWDDVKVTVADRYAGKVDIPYAAIKRANLVYEASDDLSKKAKM